MSGKLTSVVGYALALAMLAAAYVVSAKVYRAHVPLTVNLADRESNLGSFLINNQQVELGRKLCHSAVDRYPESAKAHFRLGYLHESDQRISEAMDEYRTAIRCEPEWPVPHVNLGILLGRAGRLEEAAAEFRLGGDDPSAKYNLQMTERAIRRNRGRASSR